VSGEQLTPSGTAVEGVLSDEFLERSPADVQMRRCLLHGEKVRKAHHFPSFAARIMAR